MYIGGAEDTTLQRTGPIGAIYTQYNPRYIL